MKTLVLIAVLAGAALGQGEIFHEGQFYCVNFDGQPVGADSYTYRVGGGGYMWLPIYMPADGVCEGRFEAYDDSEDAAAVIRDLFGNVIGTRVPTGSDTEIMFVDEWGFAGFRDGRSYGAVFTTGRRQSGTFAVRLPAGYYRMIVNNRFASFTPKSVTVTLGRDDARDQNPAPTYAPTRSKNPAKTTPRNRTAKPRTTPRIP